MLIDGKLHKKTKESALLVIYILEELHDKLKILHHQMRHFGLKSIWEWIRKKFWRPQLYAEVKSYVVSCKSCQEYMFFRPVYRFDGCSVISGLF
jgi:hypothetical protein